MMGFPRGIRHLLGALYAWSVTVFFGAVLLDVVYANLLHGVSAATLEPVYRGVSDFLLVLGALVLASALAAIVVSAGNRPATYLFAASLVCLSSEFIAPIFFFPLLRTSPESVVGAIGPGLRLLPIALAPLLALGALRGTFRDPIAPGHS
jgi:hypothetical protein